MSVGNSGRLVIEVDVELKKMLYAGLELENITLKEWLIRNAKNYIKEINQPSLFDSLLPLPEKKKIAG